MENPATRIIETTVGRTIFNNALTERMRFYNHELDKNGVRDLVAEVYDICGQEETCIIADQIKDIGFQYATRSGITIAIADINVPASKAEILQAAQEKVDEIDQSLERGITTEDERNKIVGDIWEETGHQVTVEVEKALDPMGDLTTMAKSGASKGGINAISQLAGMKGLVSDPSGRVITMPIRSNYREGMTPFEYYISTHGARKGLADTALRTADAGYLTRRLVDVAQDVIVNEEDCGTYQGIWINADDNIAGQSFEKRLYGRVLADRVINPETGEIVFNRNDLLTHDRVKIIKELGISAVHVRSPLTCEMIHGICANCYGMILPGRNGKTGSTVGTAAQSIGEPGTQRHYGPSTPAVVGWRHYLRLPVSKNCLKLKEPKGEAVISKIAGTAHLFGFEKDSDKRFVRIDHSEMVSDIYDIPEDWSIAVSDGDEIVMGATLASQDEAIITAQNNGRVRIEDHKVIVSYEVKESEEYDIFPRQPN